MILERVFEKWRDIDDYPTLRPCDRPVTVRTDGVDEAEAMEAIASLFERRFDEDA